MSRYTESKKQANERWDKAHKEHVQYLNKRSVSRNFIKKQATVEDIAELEALIQERKKQLRDSD
ncbi:hypothetical protein GPK34_00250 [Secundilactobacillus kimchicus]|uniref:hypothetical protein n=1 Tax=Secundilactobacillus kimchicus TaxID=528209 RepID=UPI001C035647|nr:hypothetical protein [Secundilactobacillus kimchicus]MBT9670467.1 hypothetical protein [Secundilactobacillus kimchicus]